MLSVFGLRQELGDCLESVSREAHFQSAEDKLQSDGANPLADKRKTVYISVNTDIAQNLRGSVSKAMLCCIVEV